MSSTPDVAHHSPERVVARPCDARATRPSDRQWSHPLSAGAGRMVALLFPATRLKCGRRDSNPHERLSSADFLTGYGFRRPGALAGFAVWTIPSPCPAEPGLGAARLVSTPSRLEGSGRAWLGIAM